MEEGSWHALPQHFGVKTLEQERAGGCWFSVTWGAQTGQGVEEGCWLPVPCTYGHCAIAARPRRARETPPADRVQNHRNPAVKDKLLGP